LGEAGDSVVLLYKILGLKARTVLYDGVLFVENESRQPVRARCVFSGMVQGVGFRFTAEHIARNYKVAGFARNLPDGTVEVVAEGERKEVEDFIGAIESRMSRHIRNREILWLEYGGDFRGFGIRF